ncbi:hypothetical protein RSAG8_00948, partial [Rhizoctonia solani AG-8 WAC10335]
MPSNKIKMVTNGEPSCGAINFPRFLRLVAPCESIKFHQHPIHAGTVLYGWHNTNATSSEPEEELPTYPGVSNPFQTEASMNLGFCGFVYRRMYTLYVNINISVRTRKSSDV